MKKEMGKHEHARRTSQQKMGRHTIFMPNKTQFTLTCLDPDSHADWIVLGCSNHTAFSDEQVLSEKNTKNSVELGPEHLFVQFQICTTNGTTKHRHFFPFF